MQAFQRCGSVHAFQRRGWLAGRRVSPAAYDAADAGSSAGSCILPRLQSASLGEWAAIRLNRASRGERSLSGHDNVALAEMMASARRGLAYEPLDPNRPAVSVPPGMPYTRPCVYKNNCRPPHVP
ncbi:hypothetical protein EJB05_23325, partial [Eragrostis curvula]